jgi:hypothetical protein
MNNDVLKYIADKIQEEVNVMGDDLARGGAKDHGDYKYACGIIRGLMIATSILADTAQRLEHDDD